MRTRNSVLRLLAGTILAGCFISGTMTGRAADVAVTARLQRFFPDVTLNVTKIHADNGYLYATGHKIPKDGVREVLIWDDGDISSSPSLSRQYTGKGFWGLADASADPDRLYAVRAVDAKHLKLYSSYQHALADISPISLYGSPDGYTEVNNVGMATATSNWCWNACSQMLMDENGSYFEQDTIADHTFLTAGIGRYLNWPNHLSAESVALAGFTVRKGVARIIKDLADMDSQVYGPIDDARVEQELAGSRPMIFSVGWYTDPGKPNVRAGGHVFVTWGFDGTNLKIHDPWPTLGTQILNMETFRSNGYQSTGRWEDTLATGKSLDLVFLIDTTGSMNDDIANAKSNATALVSLVKSQFLDCRIAVVEYRDLPVSPWGDPGDFITKVRTQFTTNTTTAINAINAMTTGGGADWPEAVYSAAYEALEGEIVGGWRADPTSRMIVMMGDAPGHDPEAWENGKSLGAVLAKANDPDFPIRISGVTVGGDLSALATFDTLASLSGGTSYNTATASGVSAALSSAINDLAESPRFPRLEAAVLRPKFTFPESLSPTTEDPPTSQVLQVQRLDLKTSNWKNLSTVTLPVSATSWVPPKAMPIGLYRWRMAYKFGSGIVRNPNGDIMQKTKATVITDNTWTGFQRLPAVPGDPSVVSPYNGYTTEESTVTYTFNTSVHSTSYILEIYRDGKRWKKLTVSAPKGDPDAVTLTVKVKGHKSGSVYHWRIQGLNIDRPKPLEEFWVD